MNTGDSSTQGFHWVCWHKEGDKKIYFDSYGLPPMVEVVDYLAKPGNQRLLSDDRGSKPSPVYSNSERVQFGDT